MPAVKSGTRPSRFFDSALLPWVLGLCGLLLTFYPSLLSGFRVTEHDSTDSRMNNYILEHGWRWLIGDPVHRAFWDPPIFYPIRNAAAYTDLLLGAAPLYWAWRTVGLAYNMAFHMWAMTLAALNFLVAFVMLRRVLRVRALAAAGGAFLFAFAAVRTAQFGHIQLYQHFFTIIVIIALGRLFGPERETSRERVWIALLSFSVVAQFYSGYYLSWFLGFALLLATLWGFVFADTRAPLLDLLHRRWVTLAVAAGITGLLLWPLAAHYVDAGRLVGFRPYVSADLPSLYSWFYMSPQSALYGWMSSVDPFRSLPGLHHEQWLGVGLVTSVLAASGLWRGRAEPGVRIVALTGLTIVLLTSRLPFGLEPWRAIHAFIPGANAIRAVPRAGLILLIPWAIGLAIWLGARRTAWAAALALVVMVGEQARSADHFDRLGKLEAGLTSVRGLVPARCEAFLYAPANRDHAANATQVDAMFGQLESGVPTLNGYSGNQPPEWPFENSRSETPADRAERQVQLEAWAARHHLSVDRICVTTGGEP